MSRLSNPHSLALKTFLRELSEISDRYGFTITGRADYEGYRELPEIRGNGVSLDLLYDENRRVYEAV
jgi:hypothetical protein